MGIRVLVSTPLNPLSLKASKWVAQPPASLLGCFVLVPRLPLPTPSAIASSGSVSTFEILSPSEGEGGGSRARH